MKYIIATMFVFFAVVSGCGIWGGYAPGFSGYVPPPTYSAAAYSVDPLSAGYEIPPPNTCFLHRPPPWCTGPRCLPVTSEFERESDLRLRIWMDGRAVDIPETGGFLYPGDTCWLIADAVGQHEIQARAYIGPPPLQHVADCATGFWIDATGRGHLGVEVGSLNCVTVPPNSAGP